MKRFLIVIIEQHGNQRTGIVIAAAVFTIYRETQRKSSRERSSEL